MNLPPLAPATRATTSPPARRARRGLRWRGLPALILATCVSAPDGNLHAQSVDSEEAALISVREWIPDAGRLDWSTQGDRVAFDRAGADGLSDIYSHDVESGAERCLTCEIYEFKASHCLDPVWHPSGEFLVIAVQRNAKKLATGPVDLFGTDRAAHSDLWILRRDGKAFWQITRAAEAGSAVLDPRFGFEGERLAWSERTTSRRGGGVGAFRLRSARVVFRRGVPALKDLQSQANPGGEGLLLLGSFSADDRALLVAAPPTGGSGRGLDVYRLPLDGTDSLRLTHTSTAADLGPRISPTGKKIAWISEAALRARPVGERVPASELWLMNADGSDQEALTAFNNALAEEYLGATAVGDFAWSPSGDQIAAFLLSGHRDVRSHIVLIQLAPRFRR